MATAPYLAKLLANDGRQINYNEYKLQGEDANTCGRWVVARCRNRRMTTDQFAASMVDLAKRNEITLDEATLLIMPLADG